MIAAFDIPDKMASAAVLFAAVFASVAAETSPNYQFGMFLFI